MRTDLKLGHDSGHIIPVLVWSGEVFETIGNTLEWHTHARTIVMCIVWRGRHGAGI